MTTCLLLSRQTIKATSPLGDPRVTYNLEEGQVPETNMPVRFYVKPNRADGSASILVAENLDYETTRFFTLRVRVQNVAAVPLASFTTVYVNVTGETREGVCVCVYLCEDWFDETPCEDNSVKGCLWVPAGYSGRTVNIQSNPSRMGAGMGQSWKH